MQRKLQSIFPKSIILRCLNILKKREKQKLFILSVFQVLANIFDLIGVALAGLLGVITISGFGVNSPSPRVREFISIIGLEKSSFQVQVGVLALLTATILILRTIFSIYIMKRTYLFLSEYGATLSKDTIKKLLEQPMVFITKKSSQETVFAITRGIDAITVGVLGTCVSIISDLSLLVILGIALLVVDPIIALGTMAMLLIFAFIIYVSLHARAEKLGTEYANLGIAVAGKITDAMGTYRELLVRGRRFYYAQVIGDIRNKIARAYSEIAFLPAVGKYALEVLMVVGTLGISASLFISSDAAQAAGKLAVFVAATSRIGPAAIRIQQSALYLKTSSHSAGISLQLIDQLSGFEVKEYGIEESQFDYTGFSGSVSFQEVDFSYFTGGIKTLGNINFAIESGRTLAVVGPSGAGKSTLIDLLLGVNKPDSGVILISGKPPLECINLWPGAISYVPQDIYLIEGSVKDNLSLGYDTGQFSDIEMLEALEKVQLLELVRNTEGGLDAQVGEFGTRLSGGQKQRLGIARALMTRPKLLVLDEATSSLDAETEYLMSKAIENLKGSTTIIIVAHRLSTVKDADKLIYLENGSLVSVGTFSQLQSDNPEFARQAKLLGL